MAGMTTSYTDGPMLNGRPLSSYSWAGAAAQSGSAGSIDTTDTAVISTEAAALVPHPQPAPPPPPADAGTETAETESAGSTVFTETSDLDPYTRIRNLLSQLFNSNFIDTNGIRNWLKSHINESGEILIDKSFRELLAREIGIEEDWITDAALNYFFGNQSQDGKLNGEDATTLSKLINQLEFLVPIFTAQAEAGGTTAVQMLRADDILIIDFDQYAPVLDGIDFAALYKSRDPLFLNCLEAAIDAYLSSPNATDDGKEEVRKIKLALQGYGEWDGKIPDELRRLLLAAYWGNFRETLAAHEIDLPLKLLRENEERRADLFAGIFLNYVAGHSDAEHPTAITHDLPKKITETEIDYQAMLRREADRLAALAQAGPTAPEAEE
jgi:hypothetical protein